MEQPLDLGAENEASFSSSASPLAATEKKTVECSLKLKRAHICLFVSINVSLGVDFVVLCTTFCPLKSPPQGQRQQATSDSHGPLLSMLLRNTND